MRIKASDESTGVSDGRGTALLHRGFARCRKAGERGGELDLCEETEVLVGYVIEKDGSVRSEALASAVKGRAKTTGGWPKRFWGLVGDVGIGVFSVEFEGVINRRAKVALLRRPVYRHLTSEVARVSGGHYEAATAAFPRSGHLLATFIGLEFQLPMHALRAEGIAPGGDG
jgi:hypothetical protein